MFEFGYFWRMLTGLIRLCSTLGEEAENLPAPNSPPGGFYAGLSPGLNTDNESGEWRWTPSPVPETGGCRGMVNFALSYFGPSLQLVEPRLYFGWATFCLGVVIKRQINSCNVAETEM